MKRLIIVVLYFLVSVIHAHANAWDSEISQLIKSHAQITDLDSRLLAFSADFLGKPYGLANLGEGDDGYYDADPLYRTDLFDCTTYVETVVSLARSSDLDEFKRSINQIRYKDGAINFVARNHFTDADWIPNNTHAGFVRDITFEVAGNDRVDIATAVINKQAWYAKKTLSSVQVPGLTSSEKQYRLERLRREGADIPSETVSLPFIHFDTLFHADGSVNQALLKRIPAPLIVNIVRPNWNLQSSIGTNMNISHMTFVIRRNGQLYFRHAWPGDKGHGRVVTDMPFIDTLKAWRQYPSIKGINLVKPLPDLN